MSSECVVLGDFSSLLEIAFGINLALPLFRELIVVDRSLIHKRLMAIEALFQSRTYQTTHTQNKLAGQLASLKRTVIIADEEVGRQVNHCAAATGMFSFAAFIWLWVAAYNTQCIDGIGVFLAVGTNFLPLPLALLYLKWVCHREYGDLNDDIEALKQRCINS